MSTRKVLNEFFGLKEVDAIDGGVQGIRLSGDRETMGALMTALQEAEKAEGVDPDVAAWCGKAWKAVAQGASRGGQVSLPRFEETPEDLMPDDDSGSVEGEEGGF